MRAALHIRRICSYKFMNSISGCGFTTGLGIIVLLFSNAVSFAQDIHYSQYHNSPLNLNPAQTGLFSGDIRFAANHRNQWKSVTEPYRTFSASGDMAFAFTDKNRHAAGILFNSDQAGDSKLGMMQFLISYGFSRFLGNANRHTVSLGVQAGVTIRSINYSDLTFDEQFDGDGFNPQTGNTENFENDGHTYPDVGAGFAYMYSTGPKFRIGTGFSIQHLNKPSDSFFDQEIKMNPRFQYDLKADADLTDRISLIPSLLFMSQGSFEEFTGGASVRLRINQKPGRNYALYLGGHLRQADAVIASAGMDFNNLHVGASYDVNTSQLERASDNRGGFELSAIYIITKVKPQAAKPPCPVY
jgi:type IX secretion system PorP/SprF family membrane protein